MKKIFVGTIVICMMISCVFQSAAGIPVIPKETIAEPVLQTEVREVPEADEVITVEEVLEEKETGASLPSPEREKESVTNLPLRQAEPKKAPEEPEEEYIDGEVIVIVKGGAAALKRNGDLLGAAGSVPAFTVEETLVRFAGKAPEESFQKETPDVEEITETVLLGAAPAEEVLLLHCEDTEQTIAYLGGLPGVICAQPNHIITADNYGSDEPFYNFQWGLDNKNTYDTIPADIRADEAWEQLGDDGEKDIVVAVADSGTDYTHPDLSSVMWKDGLAYPSLTALGGGMYGVNYSGVGDTADPMDIDSGHGTHCSSIIASAWQNHKGTAGVNGNVKIMACRWLAKGVGVASDACKVYGYILAAKEAGVNVRVISNSWGIGSSVTSAEPAIGYLVRKAGEMGIVSCFAAGNEGMNLDGYTNKNYPARDYMLVVGAMESGGGAAGFSNYGQTTVDVFAPGVGILAATTRNGNEETEMKPEYLPWLPGAEGSIFYEDFEGTEEPSVLLRTNNRAKTATSSTAERKLAGDDGNRAFMANFSIEAGNPISFDIEAVLTEEEIAAISAAEKVYISFQMLFDGCENAKENMYTLHIWDAESGEWVQTSKYMRNFDTNWNQFSEELDGEELLRSREGNILKLRFVSREIMPVTADGGRIYLDTFGVGTEPGEYYYASGTSMATPMAAGTVSLVMAELLSEDPSLTGGALAKKAMALVRGGTVQTQKLDSVCRTGGYVNAGASIKGSAAMHPVTDTYEENGTESVLTGWFFGETAGTVTVDGTAVTVTKWDDSSVSFLCDPDMVEHMAEITVQTADGRSGRGFFTMGTKQKGYTDLPVPEEEVDQAVLGAAGDTILAAVNRKVSDEKSSIEFWKYRIPEKEWTKINGPAEDILSVYPMYTNHFASGKTEIYYLYMKNSSEDKGEIYLATYDILEERWIYDVNLYDNADNMTMLAVYDGELLLIGGSSKSQVRKVYPDTGVIYGAMPDLCRGVGGGLAVQVGEDLYVNGAIDSFLDLITEPFSYEGKFRNVMRYSPSSGAWTESSAVFFSDRDGHSDYLDENMLCQSAMVPLRNGIMLVGPAKNNAKENMTDTWTYDPVKDSWNAVENARFDTIRTKNISAAVSGGRMYVIANSGRDDGEGALRFAALDLGEEAPAVPGNAKRDDGGRIIQLGDEYLENGYYLQGADGKLTRQGASKTNYNLLVDKTASRLVMKDLDYRYASDEMMDFSDKVMLMATGDLTIEVLGKNTLTFSRKYDDNMFFTPMKSSVTLKVDGRLTLKGSGTLTVTGVEQSMDSTAIDAREIFVNGPTLIAFADSKAVLDGEAGISRAMSVLPQSSSYRLSCMFGENGEKAAAGGEKSMTALQPALGTAKYVKIIAHTKNIGGGGSYSYNTKPLYTGTWGAPVIGGIWRVSKDGIWTYTTNAMFKNTWGYIVNPYAKEGQHTADWFWFDKNGNMLTGWQFINGKWYYLNPTKDGTLGACQLGGVTPDGWTVDESGAWIESIPKK